MPNNYVLLQRVEVGAAGAASVSFTNIPQTGYSDLKVVLSARTTRSAVDDAVLMRFNNSTTNFTVKELRGNGTSVVSSSPTVGFIGYVDGNTATANTFSNNEIYIPNYAGNTNKSFSIDGVAENNATFGLQGFLAGLWSQTAAITSIAFFPETGPNFLANSTFSLYAMAAVGVTPTVAPKASGGSITTDGTYWIHTFNSSGFFVPQVALSCDYLVVAGGGGGGADSGGGGGAGGVLTGTQSVSSGSSFIVTVGAGGAQNINGVDSVFGSFTSIGGGRGGKLSDYGTTQSTGANGGSGGGGGGWYTTGINPRPGGTATSGQGNNGGSSTGTGSGTGGGGGGGAGGSGASVTGGSGFGANGGTALSSSITGTSLSYAGGGGGGGSSGGGTGGSSIGGNGGAQLVVGGNAVANRGSGGGGGGYSGSAGGAGGSGIVILRYLVA